MPFASFLADPRHFQIATLASLLGLQLARGDIGADPVQAASTIATALVVQYVCLRCCGGKGFDWRSPLVTGLSLSLLLRTQVPALWLAAAAIAIGSKFLIRVRGKHLFNPANIAIVALLLVSPQVWVSPGQWGSSVWLTALLVCGAGLVLQRAARADIALVFLGFYCALLLARALWLGDPPAIPLHQLQSGALLIFSFFMITDPRSTPDHRLGRIGFALAVAGLGYWLQFHWQIRPGLFFALAALSPASAAIDHILPAARFTWSRLPQPMEV
jgi:Na+-transporting NADH:ubiquinone oxidoreductase subunit NqrB